MIEYGTLEITRGGFVNGPKNFSINGKRRTHSLP